MSISFLILATIVMIGASIVFGVGMYVSIAAKKELEEQAKLRGDS